MAGLDYLTKVPLHHIAQLKSIQIIGVPLHHCRTLLQVLSLVIDPSDTCRLVTELGFNVVRWKTVLVEYRAGNVTEAMSGLSSFVTKAP